MRSLSEARITVRGVAQLVAHTVWDREVACSSQVAPTINKDEPCGSIFVDLSFSETCAEQL